MQYSMLIFMDGTEEWTHKEDERLGARLKGSAK